MHSCPDPGHRYRSDMTRHTKRQFQNEHIQHSQIISSWFRLHRHKEKKDYLINISDGGKISYDCDFIEKMLEKEFLLGKKFFSTIQKLLFFQIMSLVEKEIHYYQN